MAEWVAIAVTLVIAVIPLIKRYGADENRMKNIESELTRGFGYDKEHFQHAKDDQVHFQNTELHWTSRERDELNRRLDKQEEVQQEILKEVREIGNRMYGK